MIEAINFNSYVVADGIAPVSYFKKFELDMFCHGEFRCPTENLTMDLSIDLDIYRGIGNPNF